jgi:site-specific DNA-cytosine methylase
MASKKPVAVGCHVFAGGFTMGVREHFRVPAQLERHNFGTETVEANLRGTKFVNEDNFEDWKDHKDVWGGDAKFIFGNPRCTGFSLVTSGHDETIHGPWAKCTQDIHELCKFGIAQDFDLICWESVQQAWTIGRPLLTYLKDNYFLPAGYRVAHLFLNASSFGNAQQRKRYFFVGYKADRNFNVVPPTLLPRQKLVKDVLGPMMRRKTNAVKYIEDYDENSWVVTSPEEAKVIASLPEGWCLNSMARHQYDELKALSPAFAQRWDRRCSDMPFSMHGVSKLRWEWNCPTMFSSCVRLIHPKLNRPITVGECAALMGWPDGMYPRGRNPFPQIVKGICPEVGVWLAEQAKLYLDDSWGNDDWDTAWNDQTQRWEGYDYTDAVTKPDEKVIDLTKYVPPFPEKEAHYAQRLSA